MKNLLLVLVTTSPQTALLSACDYPVRHAWREPASGAIPRVMSLCTREGTGLIPNVLSQIAVPLHIGIYPIFIINYFIYLFLL